MKRIIFILSFFASIIFCSIRASAATWQFKWEDTIITIPVGESIENYKNKPTASLYKDGEKLIDAKISYLIDGDWLYYLSDVNTSVVGEYEVWYKAYENDKYKPGTCMGYKCLIKFKVEDTIAPKIDVGSEHVRIRRNTEYDPLSNIRANDNYDKELFIESEGIIDYSKLGEYSINVYARDDSNNETKVTYTVEIYEDVPPKIIYKNEGSPLTIPLNGNVNLLEYFSASDEIDGDLSNDIEFPSIDTSKLGEFDYTVKVKNKVGLEATKTVRVKIADDEKPVISLVDEQGVIILDYKTDFTDYDFVKHVSIYDNVDINYDNLSVTHNIENKVGEYYVTYNYTDSTYNVSERLQVHLLSYDKPQIIMSDINCNVGEKIDILDYVQVIDESDPNILDSIEVYDSNIDFNTAGVYYGEIFVINSSYVSNTKRFKVIVNDIGGITHADTTSTTTALTTEANSETPSYYFWIIIGLTAIICFQAGKIKKNKSI